MKIIILDFLEKTFPAVPSFCCDIKTGCVTSKHKTSLDDFSQAAKTNKKKKK